MFITFEGIDGAGKTTVLNQLVKKLKSCKIDFVATREPGSASTHKINMQVRKLILGNKSVILPMTEAILFSLDRRIHLDKLIKPALDAKKIVISDRYFDSTIAYQGAGRKLGINKMIDLQENITDHLYPDLTFYFDVSIDEASKRLENRGKKNRFEIEGQEFFKSAIKGYKEIIAKNPNRFIVINANKSQQQVYKEVWKHFFKKVIIKKIK